MDGQDEKKVYQTKGRVLMMERKLNDVPVRFFRKSFPTLDQWDRYVASLSVTSYSGSTFRQVNRTIINGIEIVRQHFDIEGIPAGMILPGRVIRQAVVYLMTEIAPSILERAPMFVSGGEVKVSLQMHLGISGGIVFRSLSIEDQAAFDESITAKITNAKGETSDWGRFTKQHELAAAHFIRAEGYDDCTLAAIPAHHLQLAFAYMALETLASVKLIEEDHEGN
jgi:hypothetical protein